MKLLRKNHTIFSIGDIVKIRKIDSFFNNKITKIIGKDAGLYFMNIDGGFFGFPRKYFKKVSTDRKIAKRDNRFIVCDEDHPLEF